MRAVAAAGQRVRPSDAMGTPASQTAPRRFRVSPRVPLRGEVDEAARIAAVPAGLTTKGMYFAHFVARLDEAQIRAVWPKLVAPPRHGTYQPFFDYPFSDVLRWLHAVARKAHPSSSLLEALRLFGRDTVRVFLESNVGRVIKGIGVAGPRESLLRMPEMWKITDPNNTVSAVEPEPGAVRFDVDGFPGWIDCGLIGTLEQVVMNHAVEPTIDVQLDAATRGSFVVHWKR